MKFLKMMGKEIKNTIENNIKDFSRGSLKKSVETLLNSLGYLSSKKADIDLESLKRRASEKGLEDISYALWDQWKSADLVFQYTDEEIKQQNSHLNFNVVNTDLIQSYLFFAVELTGKEYTRSQLSGITRFINRLYDIPVMIIFRYNGLLTFSIINRRPGLRDAGRSVLEKITLVKDISVDSPHRAHIEILFDLSTNCFVAAIFLISITYIIHGKRLLILKNLINSSIKNFSIGIYGHCGMLNFLRYVPKMT